MESMVRCTRLHCTWDCLTYVAKPSLLLWKNWCNFPPKSTVVLWYTVYPKKYAHGFCFAVLCCAYTLTDFPISIRLTSLALWQSNDCPSASKATLMNMDKYFMWIHYERLHNHNKAKHNKTVCIFLGIYCMPSHNKTWQNQGLLYSKSQEICTPFRCALLCCGYAIVHNEFTWSIYPYSHQGCFAGTGAIVRLPQCQWSKPDGYGKISQCITTTKHSKAKTVCIFLGIYCSDATWASWHLKSSSTRLFV